MSEKDSFARMAEVEDSSFRDEVKQLNEPESRNRKNSGVPVLESNLEAGGSLLPVNVNFCGNNSANTSGSSAMVDVVLDNPSTASTKFFHINHETDHFRTSHSSNHSAVMSEVENQGDTPFHHVIELKEDKNCDQRPSRNLMLYSCHYRHCGFQAPDRDGLTEHLLSFHKGGERDSKSNLPIIRSNSAKPKEFQCDLCQMKFTMHFNMLRHKMSHLGVRPYECRICTKKFTRNDHLMEHLVRQHSKQRPYKCPFCIKSYSMKPSLKAHLASDHSGIPKDKVCRVCGFRATTIAGAKIHYTNTHLRNGASTPSATKVPVLNLEDGTVTPSSELVDEMDLARISQNFTFNTQDNVSVPTSTASFANETSLNNNNDNINSGTNNCTSQPEEHPPSSFRRYQASSSFLPLPLCSSSLPGPLLDPSFPGTSAMTDVSSSMRDKTVLFTVNSQNGQNEAPFLCSSSDLKQEPIEIDDGHNSCSSSAGAQPTSTMDNSDTIGPEDGSTLNNHPGTGDEEDMEVGNHFAAHLRNSKGSPTASGAETSGRRNNSSEEDDGSNQGRAVEQKPEINNLTRVLKNDKKRKPCHRPHCCDAGESKVSTSVRNLMENALNNARDNGRRELPDSKPPLNCVHRKRSTSSTVSTEQSSIARDSIESPTECHHCGIIFPDRTLYYLHKGMHSDSNPWKCNMCGEMCDGKYDFYAHVISREHR